MRLFLAGILVCSLVLITLRPNEPRYQGKTVTEWVRQISPGRFWLPNDSYGHIHNELWDAVVGGGYPAMSAVTNQAPTPTPKSQPDAATVAIRHIGTNAIPRLLELMTSQPGSLEKIEDFVTRKIPASSSLLYRKLAPFSAEERRVAAMKGFEVLGTNAESALPALANLLQRPNASFDVGCAISGIGPQGTIVLLNALTNSDREVRDIAAFCMDSCPEIMPALVSLVDRGQARYQVFGRIGRIGGKPELVIPALTRYLERLSPASPETLEAQMAMLILGLYREQARSGLDILVKLYEYPDLTTRQVIRVVVKNIDPENAHKLLGRAPSPKDDEDPWWGGPQQ